MRAHFIKKPILNHENVNKYNEIWQGIGKVLIFNICIGFLWYIYIYYIALKIQISLLHTNNFLM